MQTTKCMRIRVYLKAVETHKLKMSSRPVVEMAGVRTSVGFSAGYVHEKLDASHRLRELFAAADERMYQVKQSHRLSA